MAGNDPKIQIDITARDKASDTIDDVADDAERLEKLAPEVTVTADTGAAAADIADVADAAGRLSHDDTELVIRAKIDQAKGELKALQKELDDTADHADDTAKRLDKIDGGGGSELRGNAIADLTGPLGDASSAASDFAGVFDGLGDTVAATATKLGASQQLAGQLSGAMGGLGVAVAAGAAVWTLWSQHAEAARQKARQMLEDQQSLTKAIQDGDRAAAVANFRKLYGDALADAGKLGAQQEDIARFITGQADTIPGLTEKYHALQEARESASTVLNPGVESDQQRAARAVQSFEDVTAAVEASRAKYIERNGAIDAAADKDAKLADALGVTEDKQKDVAKAVRDSNLAMDRAATLADDNTAALDRLHERLDKTRAIEDFQTAMVTAQQTIQSEGKLTEEQIRAVEDSIVRAGEAAGLNPIQIQAEIDKVTPSDVNEAFIDTQAKIDAKGPLTMNVNIHPELPPRLKIVTRGGTTLLDEALVPIAAAAPAPQTVTINMPAGSRGVDVVRQVAGQARRSGRRYGSPVVTFARRR